MKRMIFWLGAVFSCVLSATAGNPSSAYIQRTMASLEQATAEHPTHVRVMFYGQSIVAQGWTRTVQTQLQERYPAVHFEFLNAAIGGYTSPSLIRTADHDLYTWYPDLLFFHVYGPVDKYEEIVKRVRERTSAEIVLWTSHLNSQEKPDALNAKLDDRCAKILEVADQYHCLKIHLRKKWCDYLIANNMSSTNLLRDSVHLKPEGCDLYAKFISEELVYAPELGNNPTFSGTIKTVDINDPAVEKGADNRLTIRFTGNRVVAVSDGTGKAGAQAQVLLDGKPMANDKALWAIKRPSNGPAKIWMPAINNIAFNTPLLEEVWTLTCLPDSTPDGTKIHFKVVGSKTGEDGEGWNTERFVSKSGRVIIEPMDWRIPWTLSYKKATLPEGFQVTWQAYPQFTATYTPQATATRTVLMQGCSNTSHTLTLVPQGGSLGIREFVIHTPPLD